MNNISDLSGAVVIKTDQINAEDFMGGMTMDITVTKVDYNPKLDQPLHLHSEGKQPFKPCLTMRKALLDIWGTDGAIWIGRTLTLYRKDNVNWGKQKNIGGVRFSHLSHMENPTHTMMLSVRRGLREEHTFYRWEPQDHTAVVNQFNAEQDQAKRDALWAGYSQQQQAAIQNSINGVK